jgi:agmatinase
MKTTIALSAVVLCRVVAISCSQTPLAETPDTGTKNPSWLSKYGPQNDQPFSGPLSFAHLPYTRCLENEEANFDIALLGMPFDTGVTYRPGYAAARVL